MLGAKEGPSAKIGGSKNKDVALYLWSNMLDRLLIGFFTRQLRVISIIEKVREGRL